MPLLDHFAPPLSTSRRWEGFHNGWAENIATALNEVLPAGYVAEPNVRYGPRVEIDVAANEVGADPVAPEGLPRTAVAFQPEAPHATVATTFPDTFEVLVTRAGARGGELVAAVELISPSNKDRAAARSAFVAKCSGILAKGMGLAVIDVVTERSARLHDELLELLALREADAARLPAQTTLAASAYRPLRRGAQGELEVWLRLLELGHTLPTLPLWIGAEVVVPLALEESYRETCRRHRIDMDRLAAALGRRKASG